MESEGKNAKEILDMMEREVGGLTRTQRNTIEEFLRVTLECDSELLDAIDHQVPMTAELYQTIVKRLEELDATRTLEMFRNDFTEFAN